MKTIHRICYQNAEKMDMISSGSADLVVTSPPYPMIQMWDNVFIQNEPLVEQAFKNGDGIEAFELMHSCLDRVWSEIYRILKFGGLACINIGDATRTINSEFGLFSNHSRIITFMTHLGFTVLPEILWRKQTNAPNKFMGSGMLPAGAYVTLEHEHVLIFRKGSKRKFKTEPEKQLRRESAFFWEERNIWFSDIWLDLKGTTQILENSNTRSRSAAFPFDLPYRLIHMYSVKGDTVVDPFMGTGTTMFAAMAAARNSIGLELEPEFNQMVSSFIPSVQDVANHKIVARLRNHVDFIHEKAADQKTFKHINRPYGFPVVTGQEKNLIINRLESVTQEGDGFYRVTYSDKPQTDYSDNWSQEHVSMLDHPADIGGRLTRVQKKPIQRDIF